jgi:peptidoglycan/xylan/chitin deacetylase (PgdA/CDA1 family)
MIKISIVIPALNEEKLLPECLASLRNQDYKGEYEIIVADNGSTDDTAGIAKKFGAKVVSCPERKSVFYARQAGADAASSEIIAQADADTVYPREWLRRIADQLASHPEAVAVSGRFIYGNPPWWAKFEYLLRNGVNRLTAALFGRPLVVSGATLAFRRQAFLSVSGYRGLSYSPDQYGISSRLSKLGKVLYDKNLCVSTSSRSVQKPVFRLITDVLAHLNRWSMYFCNSSISTLREYAFRTPSRRIAVRLSPLVMIFVFLAAYGYFIPTSLVFGKVYYEGTSRENVALTFDDGPNEPYTSQILDILASHNIKATFFVVGKNVELYPETTRRIIAEGNVVGNHSYSHNANHALTEHGAKDLERAQETIDNTVGIRPHLYRPPHGKKSPWELEAVKKGGLIEVTWSVSANDQHVLAFLGEPSPETFAREIVSRTNPGEIILLHDGYGTLHDTVKADKSLTVKALPLIIEQLQTRGYRFVTVPELLNVPAYNEALP